MLYYDFPEAYDLFFSNEFTGATLDFYKKIFSGTRIKDVLDCTAGTGQMTKPLVKLGFSVTLSDINRKMIRKARQNFAKEELEANFSISDILKLKMNIKREFDCVMATGNSLAHIKNEQLPEALNQMDALLRPGGMLYLDSRNWDKILERQQRFYLFNPIVREKGRINYLQVWDYNRDGSMTHNFLISEEIENKIVSKRQFYVIYYPFENACLPALLTDMNYENIRIFKLGDPSVKDMDEIDWYTIVANKPRK
ncbi:MAG: class I SAM-dependent methyltransferase [Candidatus Cloacimonetes bacterium]|nr:class I SAM-dependent methyltransferase [Candidatus Cloacimonadota bacterium]